MNFFHMNLMKKFEGKFVLTSVHIFIKCLAYFLRTVFWNCLNNQYFEHHFKRGNFVMAILSMKNPLVANLKSSYKPCQNC